MRIFLSFYFLFILLCLSSCSHLSKTHTAIQNRDKHYLEARSIKPLIIPAGVSSHAFDNYYPVSDRTYPGAKYVDLTPPGLEG